LNFVERLIYLLLRHILLKARIEDTSKHLLILLGRHFLEAAAAASPRRGSSARRVISG
jgi:hypothetical protein